MYMDSRAGIFKATPSAVLRPDPVRFSRPRVNESLHSPCCPQRQYPAPSCPLPLAANEGEEQATENKERCAERGCAFPGTERYNRHTECPHRPRLLSATRGSRSADECRAKRPWCPRVTVSQRSPRTAGLEAGVAQGRALRRCRATLSNAETCRPSLVRAGLDLESCLAGGS